MTQTETIHHHHGAAFVIADDTVRVTIAGTTYPMTRDEARGAWAALSAQHRSYRRPADVALGGRILHGW